MSLYVARGQLSGCLDVVVLLIPDDTQVAPWWTLEVPRDLSSSVARVPYGKVIG